MTTPPLVFVRDWLIGVGFDPLSASICWRLAALIVILLIALSVEILLRRIGKRILKALVARTKTTWDDVVVEAGFIDRIIIFIPAVIAYRLLDLFYPAGSRSLAVTSILMHAVLIVLGVLAVDTLLNAFAKIYRQSERARTVPIKGFLQVIKIVLYFVAIILLIATVLGKSPVYLFSGLGALTAVLMLVFKDAILGFVAGIQLTTNRMVAIGDWLEMPKYGADGDVIDIALTTVKVQNWDKTITTIPTYALISDSFKNWRGMQESGGRRIMRSINIDLGTVKFCDQEMLDRFAKIQYIQDYLDAKKKEIGRYNEEIGAGSDCLVNGRHLTNLGTFRAYVVAYLRHHPQINQEMTFLVRQLQPGPDGVPIQIYVFCKDKVWANYEAIQADIFDHILAVVPEFDLRLFQNPSGTDFRRIYPNR